MPSAPHLVAVSLMGLLGSAHCIGMCGGFGLLARSSGSVTAWALGKTLTYSVLGFLAGGVGHVIMQAMPFQQALSLVVGIVLILLGAASAGLIPDRLLVPGALMRRLGPWLGRATRASRPWGSLGLGLVNGLLPCGLVYAALMKSMETGSPAGAALSMAVFGGATLPGLLLLVLLGDRLKPSWRGRVTKMGGWLVLLLGAVTVWRAVAATGAHGM